MKKIFTLSALTLALAACGGGGGGDVSSSITRPQPSTTPSEQSSNTTPSKICVDTLTIQGVDIKVSDYDTDKDGCLNKEEMDKAKEEIKKQTTERTVTSKATLEDDANPENNHVTSASLVGNAAAETLNGRKTAIVHYNKTFKVIINYNWLNISEPTTSGDVTTFEGFQVFPSSFSLQELAANKGELFNKHKGINIWFKKSPSPIDPTTTVSCTYSDGSANNSIPANHIKCGDDIDIDLTGMVTDQSKTINLYVFASKTETNTQTNKSQVKLLSNAAIIPFQVNQP